MLRTFRKIVSVVVVVLVLVSNIAPLWALPFVSVPLGNWYRGGATLDMDFVNDRYYINGTSYTGVNNFISGAGATFTRSGTANFTSIVPPFYMDSAQGQSFVSRSSSSYNVTSTVAPFYTSAGGGQAFVSRGSSATYFDNTGTLQTASTNVARSSTYSYNGSSWVANSGTLIEPAATNLYQYSSQFNNAYWTGTGYSVTVNATTSPDGTVDADSFLEDGSNGNHYLYRNLSAYSLGTTVTMSVFAQAAGRTNLVLYMDNTAGYSVACNFDLSAGTYNHSHLNSNHWTGLTASITNVGNGWYRCSITATKTVTEGLSTRISLSDGSDFDTFGLGYYQGNGSSGVNLWGAQVEIGSSATSYIATTTATVTRSADVYSQEPASYFDSTGTLQYATANTARTNYTYSGGSWTNSGTLLEPAATNYIRNNTMQGAVAADGVERVTTGTFGGCSGASCTGWTTTVNGGTGTVSFASNTATLTGDGTNAASIYQSVPTTSGYSYVITLSTGAGNAVTVQAGASSGGTGLMIAQTVAASSTNYYLQFTATGTSSYIQINNTSTTAAAVTLVSVKSAGYFPTNWSSFAGVTYGSGLAVNLVGTGVESGINYIDVQFVGTASQTYQNLTVQFDSGIAATVGQPWTASIYSKLTAGSWGTDSQGPEIVIQEFNSGGTYLTQDSVYNGLRYPTSSALDTQRWIMSTTLQNAATAKINCFFIVQYVSGSSVNFTIRIGMPQLEQSSYVTNPIPTASTSVTRNADVYSVPDGGTYYNSAGILKMASVNTPRLDYGPTGGNQPQGVLIEESRTNLMYYSGVYNGGSWSTGQSTATNFATTAPDGSTTAVQLVEDTSTNQHTVGQGATVTAGQVYTFSVYVKSYSGDRNVELLLYDGTDGNFGGYVVFNPLTQSVVLSGGSGAGATYTATKLANGWSRLSVSGTPTVTYFGSNIKIYSGTNYSYTGNGTSGIYYWGAQLEAGAYPTSYIPTTAATVTRPAETFSVPTTAGGGWWTAGIGTLLASGIFVQDSTAQYPGLADLYGGTGNVIDLYMGGASLNKSAAIYSGGPVVFSTQPSAYTTGNLTKGAIAFSASGANAAFDGTLGTASGAITVPTITGLNVGADANNFYGDKDVQRITYIPQRVADASLVDFTH